MPVDWTGNATSIYATHGASNHSEGDRANLDYYATDPEAVEKLLEKEGFSITYMNQLAVVDTLRKC